MNNDAFITVEDSLVYEKYGRFINQTYPSFLEKLGLSAIAAKAEKATITDSKGKVFVDCSGGYGVYNVGHNNPEVIDALRDQLQHKQLNTRPLITDVAVNLAERLSKLIPGVDNFAFVCNSGSEAVDSAIKLTRIHKGKKKILSAINSFHGYTFGALSASGIPSFKRLFEPVVPEMHQVPFNDIAALRSAMTPDTAAVLLEPVQHEAGVAVPGESYFREVRQLCDEHNVLLILDEIKTGLGRTGRMFSYEHFGFVPDMLLLGKSLGGGLMPIGALVARRDLEKKFSMSFPMSASSYAGNTLACRAALATLEILEHGSLIEHAAGLGNLILEHMGNSIRKFGNILQSVQGLGLLIGIEISNAGAAFALSKELVREGFIVLPAFGKPSVLMIEPPLVISREQIQNMLGAFDKACERLT